MKEIKWILYREIDGYCNFMGVFGNRRVVSWRGGRIGFSVVNRGRV